MAETISLSSADIASRLDKFRESDKAREELLFTLARDYEDLRKRYEEKCEDLAGEQVTRRVLQRDLRTVEIKLADTEARSEGNPFALVLIDGDGAIFKDAILQAGSDGGSDAAHRLLKAVREHLVSQYPNSNSNPRHWTIMVHIFANVEGLARKLVSVNILKHVSDMTAFTRSFTLNQPLFNFIDVGVGKERADHKIKETLRLFITNSHCKHIVFGGCHDNGYLPNLEQYKHDKDVFSRISLLETYTMAAGFRSLSLQSVSFDDVFRSTPLPDGAPPPTPITLPLLQKQVSGGATVAKSSTNITSGTNGSWAGVSKAGTTGQTITIAATPKPGRKFILQNAHEERLDIPIAKADRESQARLYERIQSNKLCNDFHIRGTCYQSGQCPYTHGERLVGNELLALRNMARNRLCPDGSYCVDFDCTHGHVCQQASCSFPKCYFEAVHGVTKKAAIKLYEDDTYDVLV